MTEHSVIEPSFFVSFTFVRAVPLRMVLLPFGHAVAHTFQPFRLGMTPLPHVCCVAGFATGSDNHRMSVDPAETG
jgi:hypothetical protein